MEKKIEVPNYNPSPPYIPSGGIDGMHLGRTGAGWQKYEEVRDEELKASARLTQRIRFLPPAVPPSAFYNAPSSVGGGIE